MWWCVLCALFWTAEALSVERQHHQLTSVSQLVAQAAKLEHLDNNNNQLEEEEQNFKYLCEHTPASPASFPYLINPKCVIKEEAQITPSFAANWCTRQMRIAPGFFDKTTHLKKNWAFGDYKVDGVRIKAPECQIPAPLWYFRNELKEICNELSPIPMFSPGHFDNFAGIRGLLDPPRGGLAGHLLLEKGSFEVRLKGARDSELFCAEISAFHQVQERLKRLPALAPTMNFANRVSRQHKKIAYELYGWTTVHPLWLYTVMEPMFDNLENLICIWHKDTSHMQTRGGGLACEIRQTYVQDGASLKSLIWQMVDVTTRLHATGFASNDIKLDNFMVRPDDHYEVQLIDFGETLKPSKYMENAFVAIPGSGYAQTMRDDALAQLAASGHETYADEALETAKTFQEYYPNYDVRIMDMYRLGIIILQLVMGRTFYTEAGYPGNFPLPLGATDTRNDVNTTPEGQAWMAIVTRLFARHDGVSAFQNYDQLFGRYGESILADIAAAPIPNLQ